MLSTDVSQRTEHKHQRNHFKNTFGDQFVKCGDFVYCLQNGGFYCYEILF